VPPQQFGPYVVEGLLGRGGMGEVYRAYDTEHRRTVALKLLSGQLAADPEFQERFRREAFLTASLSEPHVIPIHRYGEIDGQLFLDMRLVDGESLEDRLARSGAMPPAEALAILEQVAAALDAAHAADLVHRDVKPSNILLTGRPDHPFAYLVDFGIARSLSDQGGRSLTQVGSAVGSFDYMAPERFLQQPATSAVDVYALSCVLYECLTGRRPFLGDALPALMYAHLDTRPQPPSATVPNLPPVLDDVLMRGLAKDPAQRPPTAGALVDAAWAALRSAPAAGRTSVGVPLPPPPPGAPPPGPSTPPRRRTGLLVGLAVAAVVVLGALAVLLSQTLGERADAGGNDPSASGDPTGTATGDGEPTPGSGTAAGTGGAGSSVPGVAPDPDPVPEASGDSFADGAAGNCFSGIITSCDSLFTPRVPPAHATYGSTCGGRAPETRGGCLEHFSGDPEPADGLGSDPAMDALAQECFAGVWEACDQMHDQAEAGSFYEDYGERCGGRLPPPLHVFGECTAIEE
jgi:serine/threonine protein kinase